MSASKKSGGSSQCCPCDDGCFSTNSKGTRKFSKKNKRIKSGPVPKNSGDCCEFDFGPDSGLHPGTPGGDPPCFKGENGPDGVKMKNKDKVKNELKNKLKEACPSMSDEEADKMADDLVNDLEAKMEQAADQASVPDSNVNQATGQSGPCGFTMCLDDYKVDPNTGTAEGDGYNDNADVNHSCNPNPPNYGNPPTFPNPGPIPNPPL